MERRIILVFILFLLFFVTVIAKLFYWQVLSYDSLEGMAQRQREVTLPIQASRGNIYSSDGSPMVVNQHAYGLYFEPKKNNQKDDAIKLIAETLNTDTASISAKLSDNALLWVPIAHKVEEDKKKELEKYNIKGLDFIEESKRFYPEASMAAHLLGFVGQNSKGEDQGYFGIEGFYNEQLRGRNGYLRQAIDASGNPILSADLEKIPAEDGRDLTLFLDKTVQYIIEKKLNQGIEKYQAKGGTIVVLEPKTGGLLGMASYPSYSQTDFYDFKTELYKNPAVSSSFEPGSIFKTLVMAAGINEGKVTAETKYNEDGPLVIGGYTINTWNQKYHGEITLTQVLEYSSNVGMVFVEKQIPKDIFYKYLTDLRFGTVTGVDLEDETSPDLRGKDKWSEIDYATASFGQGIAVTPLQMVRAVAAIANRGVLMEPHAVKSIKLANGSTFNITPKKIEQIFKPEVAATVAEMMVQAVENGETRLIKPAGYKIAGKTGTAQIPIAGHYDTDKTIASFVGFAPVTNPKFVMLVTLREPGTSPWGSETAAPMFFSIAQDLFSYFKISPSD